MAEKQWLTYKQAAKRVNSSVRTIRNWGAWGMPLEWQMIEGQRTRVVELDVLLAFWRKTMRNSPAHFYRVRARMAEEGIALETPDHVKAMHVKGSETRQGIRPPGTGESAAFGRTEPESGIPEPVIDPLADMKPLRGGAEFYDLTEALRVTTPLCAGLPEFTADRVDAETTAKMFDICSRCPLLEQCDAFATASKPVAGFWAGAARR